MYTNIIESYINGQHKQMFAQIRRLGSNKMPGLLQQAKEVLGAEKTLSMLTIYYKLFGEQMR